MFVAVLGVFACRTAAPSPRSSETTPPAVARAAASPGTVWLLFVDDLHFDFRRTGYVKDFLKRLANELIQDGDMFAVRSSGPSSLAVDLTADRGLLEGAIQRTSGAGLTPFEILDAGQGPGLSAELLYRAKVALSAANEMMKGAPPVDDRPKALIYISSGYDFELSTLRGQVSALTRDAKALRIRIFAVDPRGLGSPPTPGASVGVYALAAHLAMTRKSLRFIAEQTGGFAEHDDLGGALNRIGAAVRGPAQTR